MPESITSDIIERVDKLRKVLHRHNHRYYVLDNPEISDSEYDLLMQKLIELEAKWPVLLRPDSPSQRVGAPPLSVFKTVTHSIPMLSLDNGFKAVDILEFDQRVQTKQYFTR